ncbi:MULTISPECIES: hypothetical protein [unclassified Lactobacillus]|uniref:hypothetical protein n=1 Tax=unclassified Lactobacillus TaxID=2620435 RepID=UPI002269DD87|nr:MULTISPECIES: hypothetical protein [unclassified Lactobacillus]MCX8721427.1 hypothetical protein [Lactobacillus sp. B4010]MCX8732403.1 hypothetical protein [Lactobacillus sp. B4015]MCX8734623.1 hypothetical protein [Lactobacillus sp. B4012]
MKIKNDKEIVIGRAFGRFGTEHEVPFFVKDIKQLCFNPFADTEYKYSVLVNTILSDEDVNLLISKEKYEYLMEKLGANDDDN